MLIGAYMDIDRCLKVLKVPTGAYRCLQVGTGGHRWQVLGDLQICPNNCPHPSTGITITP